MSGQPRFYAGDGATKFMKFESVSGEFELGPDVKMAGGNRLFMGFVSNTGSLLWGPSGWSVTRTAVGRFEINHGFGDSSQSNTAAFISLMNAQGPGVMQPARIANYLPSRIQVELSDVNGSFADEFFSFFVVKN